jgi:serine/threonine protein kinase
MKCPNCFADKQTATQCPSCGYKETLTEQNPLYLKPRTLLNQRYLIGNVIGHGGFGITYMSWDCKLERKIAIKEFLPTALATRTWETNEGQIKYTVTAIGAQKEAFKIGLKKFLKEAKILASFTHDNIVRVIDYFENYETGYIVMEYVGQEDLSQLVKRQPEKRLPVAAALKIFLPILNALKIIHANGIYHQDISLQNIRMVDGHKPILIDFGAARYIVREISQSVERVFKPGYSPVEQITSRGKIGPWTDIYACGAMFYAMIVGKLPPQSVDRLDQDDLIPPNQQIEISTALNDAVLKALSVRIGDRFQTAEEFATALKNSLKTNKKKRLLAMTASVFLVIAVATVGVIVFDPFHLNWKIPIISDSKPSSSVPPASVVLVPESEENQAKVVVPDQFDPHRKSPVARDPELPSAVSPPSAVADEEVPQLVPESEENQAKVVVPDQFDPHQESPAASDPELPSAVSPPSAVADEEVPQLVPESEENQAKVVVPDQFDPHQESPAASDPELPSAVSPPSAVADEEVPQLVPEPEENQAKVVVPDQFDPHQESPAASDPELPSAVSPPSAVADEEVPQLVSEPEENQEIQLVEEQIPGSYPEASTRHLTPADLSPLSKWQLKIMKNEIFARHGYIFQTQAMKEYFQATPWYYSQFDDVSHLLTPIEQYNIQLIQQELVEEQVPGWYPEASTRQLTPADLSPLSKEQLKIMRNEIFARHGYIFQTQAMKEYFQATPWYYPQFDDVSHLLTPIEQYNIQLIQQQNNDDSFSR